MKFKLLPILLLSCLVLGGSLYVAADQLPYNTDLNNDGVTNIYDLSILLSHYGQTGTNIIGDINHDGVVDKTDLQLLNANIKVPNPLPNPCPYDASIPAASGTCDKLGGLNSQTASQPAQTTAPATQPPQHIDTTEADVPGFTGK